MERTLECLTFTINDACDKNNFAEDNFNCFYFKVLKEPFIVKKKFVLALLLPKLTWLSSFRNSAPTFTRRKSTIPYSRDQCFSIRVCDKIIWRASKKQMHGPRSQKTDIYDKLA